MERIRDFFYDISDLLISLIIIASIFFVISWKLNQAIPIDSTSAPPVAEAPATPSDNASDGTDITSGDGTDAGTDIADASDADKPIDTVTDSSLPPTDSPTATEPAAPPSTPTPKDVVIEIPSGSPGVAIGKILKDNGLITDVNVFIQKVDELGLGPKLRSGSFTLNTSMSLEAIIKTLANVN